MSHVLHGMIFELNGLEEDVFEHDHMGELPDSIQYKCEEILSSYINHVFSGFDVKRVLFGREDKDEFIKIYTDFINETSNSMNHYFNCLIKAAEKAGMSDGNTFFINKDNISKLYDKQQMPVSEYLGNLVKIVCGEYSHETSVYYYDYGGTMAENNYIHNIYNNPEKYAMVIFDIHY